MTDYQPSRVFASCAAFLASSIFCENKVEDKVRMTDRLAKQAEACVSTSGSPLSMLAPETWQKCFVEFFYGDAVPNMKE